MPATSEDNVAAERHRLAAAMEMACRSLDVECDCPSHLLDEVANLTGSPSLDGKAHL